jgi:hypothetical protein
MSVPAAADLSGLASLARDPRLDLRPVLLRVQTDLFLAAPTRDATMVEAFEALACGLLPALDDASAARLARKLAPYADAPQRVLELLMKRSGDARHAVVAGAPRLAQALLDAALAAGGDVACALAQRSDLDGHAVVGLIALADDGVDFTLAMNRGAELPGPVLDELIERARTRPALGHALLARGDLTGPEEAALYVYADAPRRVRIRERIAPLAAVRRAAAGEIRQDDLTELAFHARHDKAAFEGRLAGLLELPSTPEWRFDHPGRHELLALALTAAGVPSDDAIRLFLLAEPSIARSVATVFELAELSRALTQPLAATLLEAILGTAVLAARRGRHVPAMDPSGTPQRTQATQHDGDRALLETVRRVG